MKESNSRFKVFLLGAVVLLVSSVSVAQTVITTKVLRVNLLDSPSGQFAFFKIENPTDHNPAGCLSSEWVGIRFYSGKNYIIEEMIDTKRNDLTVTITINDAECVAFNAYPLLQSVSF